MALLLRAVTSLPAVLGATLLYVIVAFGMLRRAEYQSLREFLKKIRADGVFDPAKYSHLTPARFKAIVDADAALRGKISDHDYALLMELMRQSHHSGWYAYSLTVVVFAIGMYVHLNTHPLRPHHEVSTAIQPLYQTIETLSAFQREAMKRHLDATSQLIQRGNEADAPEIAERLAYVQAFLAYMRGEWESAYGLAKGDSEQAILLRAEVAWMLQVGSPKAMAEVDKLRRIEIPLARTVWFLKVAELSSINRNAGATVDEINANLARVSDLIKELQTLAETMDNVPTQDAASTVQDILALKVTLAELYLDLQCDAAEKGSIRGSSDVSQWVDNLWKTRRKLLGYEALTPQALTQGFQPVMPMAAAVMRGNLLFGLHRMIARISARFPDVDANVIARFKDSYSQDHERLSQRLEVAFTTSRDKLNLHLADGYFLLGQADFTRREYARMIDELKKAKQCMQGARDSQSLRDNIDFFLSVATAIEARDAVAAKGIEALNQYVELIDDSIDWFRTRPPKKDGTPAFVVEFSDVLMMKVFLGVLLGKQKQSPETAHAEYRTLLAKCHPGLALACRTAWFSRLESEPDEQRRSKAKAIINALDEQEFERLIAGSPEADLPKNLNPLAVERTVARSSTGE